MTAWANSELTAFLLAFCRIGGCLMLAPWFGTLRVPARFRAAVALTFAALAAPAIPSASVEDRIDPPTIVTEVAIGISMGVCLRLVASIAQTAGNLIATQIGLMVPGAPSIDDGEPVLPPADILGLATLTVALALDVHHIILLALLRSYDVLPVGGGHFDLATELQRVISLATTAFATALRIASPLIAIGFALNLLLGITNRLVPTVPIQFLSGPLLVAAGLFLLTSVIGDLLAPSWTLIETALSRR
jgi:flagellar biosynthesis protein FliR